MIGENYRLPMVPMTPANRTQIQKIAEELGIIQSVGANR